jgi:hypothetical protein
VAAVTKCDQVFFLVVAGMTAKFLVMNLEVIESAAILTTP